MSRIPEDIQPALKKAKRLEWWTLFWQATIVAVMALVMGSSQAMKSAWVEDVLGLVPAVVFLIAAHFERKQPNRKFHFGYLRVNSLAFAVSASALVLMAGYLIFDSASKLVAMEHPTIGPVTIFGQTVWMGWVMMAALVYSVIPPMFLGWLKKPVAEKLQDKVLHTDALMQKADWMTGLAASAGIIGLGFGLWWADSVAAIIVAVDIARDGLRAARVATAELIDGAPRKLENDEIADDAKALKETLKAEFPGADIRLRETGRFIAAEVYGAPAPQPERDLLDFWPGPPERSWRLASISFGSRNDADPED